MGEFVRSYNSITFTHDDDVLIGGISYNQKYPGYRFYSNSSDCNVLTEIDGEKQIIEVYGERYIITTEDEDDNLHRYFTQDTVAVLKDEDAKLYQKLQWLNRWRWHGTIQLANTVFCIYLGVLLLVTHFIVSLFIIASDNTFIGLLQKVGEGLFFSLLFVVAEIFLLVVGSRFLRLLKGFISVLVHILRGKEKLSYYKQLFEKLSKANCRDKAKSAKCMHKVLFFC